MNVDNVGQWMQDTIISLSFDELFSFAFTITFFVLLFIALFSLPDIVMCFRKYKCKKNKKLIKAYREKYGVLNEKK